MENNYIYQMNDNKDNASFVTMDTTNQMMTSVALYPSTEPTFSNTNQFPINTFASYEPQITSTPVVKSHHPIPVYNTPIVQQQNMYPPPMLETNMSQFSNSMEIDDYNNMISSMQNLYSPSSTTTNNSSIMFMDSSLQSPSSPTSSMTMGANNYNQPMDPFVNNYPPLMMTDNTMTPIIATDIGMYTNYTNNQVLQYNNDYRKNNRRQLPRRHTVSTPYNPNNNKGKEPEKEIPIAKSPRKQSLKAKRHRSLGKLDIYTPPIPDTTKLESWTHEQLLERVKELEKEVAQNSLNKVTPEDGKNNKVKSASQTDTEEDDEDEADGPRTCKWDTCILEFENLNSLIEHVKIEHIGSGKANYYCCWKDCARKQKPFTKRHKMHNHLRTHTGERPFVCEEPDCGKRFSRLDSLATHTKIHSNIRPYLCNIADCGKAYYHLRSLRKHERSHSQLNDVPPLPSQSEDRHEFLTDWGISVQAAVFNIMDRENQSYL